MKTTINRRTVLRNAAAILPAAAIRGTAANDALRVGLLGAGNRGPYVAGTLAKNTPAKVVAICDLVDERIEKAKSTIGSPAAQGYKDFHKMLASDIDAIIIATPVFLHADHLEAAVKAGKHIYIEKPAAATVADCKRIMRIADSADRKLNISFGFQRRYSELYLKAKQIADAGAVGNIRFAMVRFIKSESEPGEPFTKPTTEKGKIEQWGAWRDLSGDLIVENNVHSIDVMNWFLNAHPVSAVGAGGMTTRRRGDMRDHNFVAYEYPNGVQGQLSGATIASPGYRDVVEQFFGDKGMLETSENHMKHFRGRGQETFEKTPRNNTIDSVSAFVQRVTTGKPENTAVRGVESTLTAILGRVAMDRKGEVTWNELLRG